jgi:hypothetical protein
MTIPENSIGTVHCDRCVDRYNPDSYHVGTAIPWLRRVPSCRVVRSPD